VGVESPLHGAVPLALAVTGAYEVRVVTPAGTRRDVDH
jgi:hypothetical protein